MKYDEKQIHEVEVLAVAIQKAMAPYESKKGLDLVQALKSLSVEFEAITSIPMDAELTTKVIDGMIIIGKLASNWQPDLCLQLETIYRIYQLMRRQPMETKFVHTLSYLRLLASGINL